VDKMVSTSLAGVDLFLHNIVTYWVGSYAALGLLLIVLLIIVITSVGIDFRFSIIFTLPVLAGLIYAGWFAALGGWIMVIAMLLAGFIYGYAILKIING